MANTGNITLYYIDGISRENTPYFSSYDVQISWFATKAVSNLVDGFYVPHFQDTIVLSVSDIGFATKVNYLSLLFNNKMYYYFIDSVTYLSETDLEIAISMDTIQTFMFNIEVHDSILERSHIARFIDGKINRDYIRENLSNGVWQEPVYGYLDLKTNNKIMYTIIAQSSVNADDYYDNTKVFYYNNKLIFDTSIKLYVPFVVDETPSTLNAGTGEISFFDPYYNTVEGTEVKVDSDISHSWGYLDTTTKNDINQYNIVAGLMVDPNIESLVVIPFMPFQIVYSVVGNVKKLSIPGCKITEVKHDMGSGVYRTFGYAFEIDSGDVTYVTGNRKDVLYPRLNTGLKDSGTFVIARENSATQVPYSSDYITQMVDDNYLSVNFGERSYTATYPLYYTDAKVLYCRYGANVSSGVRYYGISDDVTDVVFSKSGLVSAPPIYLTKINDAWLSWLSQNRATMPMAAANFLIQCMASGVGTTTVSQMAKSEVVDEHLNDTRKRRNASTGGRLFTTFSNKRDNTKNNFYTYKRVTNSNRMPSASSLIDVATSAQNAWLAPDSIKQTTEFLNDYISGSCRIIKYSLKVIDFEQVAFYYHRFGFLINKPYKSYYHMGQLVPLFNGLYTSYKRYYFNYYKFQYVDIDLTVMCSADMVDDVAERLVEGVRVWYVEHGSMCDYSYDNVEVSS